MRSTASDLSVLLPSARATRGAGMGQMNANPALVISALLWLPLAAPAAEYRINSQADFDRHRTATFKPGDRILLRNGRAFSGMFAPRGSGRKGAPIRIAASGAGRRPIINALGRSPAGILLKNVDHWEIEGIEITNTDGSAKDQGQLFGIHVLSESTGRTMNRVYIRNCHVHDVNGKVAGKKRGGIHVHATGEAPSRFHDLRIVGNTVERVGGVGIGNSSSHASVRGEIEKKEPQHFWTKVYVADNFVDSTGRNAIIARVSDGAVYEHNTLANSSRYSTGHSIFNFNTKGIKIQFNEAYGNVGEGGRDRGGFDADYNSINTYIQYNYSHDNYWFCGIMRRWNKNVFVRYNISQNDRKGVYFYGFKNETGLENLQVYNNTHYIRRGLDVEVICEGRSPLNSTFSNNIFYFEGRGKWGVSRGGNTRFDSNLYFNISPHPGDRNAVTADPLLSAPGRGGTRIDMKAPLRLAGYRLRPGSPCIDTGRRIKENGSRDFWGNEVPAGKP
ncbi:MAG: right-handed parallel beta-helix repeat-containing protein, partial [Planctomycetota bacterium]